MVGPRVVRAGRRSVAGPWQLARWSTGPRAGSTTMGVWWLFVLTSGDRKRFPALRTAAGRSFARPPAAGGRPRFVRSPRRRLRASDPETACAITVPAAARQRSRDGSPGCTPAIPAAHRRWPAAWRTLDGARDNAVAAVRYTVRLARGPSSPHETILVGVIRMISRDRPGSGGS